MAKKKAAAGPVNVSELIRNTWDEDQSQKPAAIVEALKARGVETSPGTVATTISLYRKKLGLTPLRGKVKRRKGVTHKSATAIPTASEANGSISNVLEALKLVAKAKELVGADGLKELVKAV